MMKREQLTFKRPSFWHLDQVEDFSAFVSAFVRAAPETRAHLTEVARGMCKATSALVGPYATLRDNLQSFSHAMRGVGRSAFADMMLTRPVGYGDGKENEITWKWSQHYERDV